MRQTTFAGPVPTVDRPAPLRLASDADETVGSVLHEVRTRARMTQDQLAGLSTVSVRAIRDLEHGRVGVPRQDTLRLLADALRLGDASRERLERAAGIGRDLDVAGPGPGAGVTPPAVRPVRGRDTEVRHGVDLLAGGATRVVQVTGLPGVGKTKVAAGIASLLRAERGVAVVWAGPDGAAGVPGPFPAADPALLDAWADGDLDRVHAGLTPADRATLLVVDGDDLDRTGGTLAGRLPVLLAACPSLLVVVTSRRATAVPGAATLPLTGLDVAGRDPAALAVMTGAARCACPTLDLDATALAHLAGTARALDGVPQALEQAAEWLLVSSPEDVHAVADRDPLAVVGDEYARVLATQLPAPRSRWGGALARLAEIGDGWTLAAVAELLDLSTAEAVRTVREWVRDGWVRGDGGRFEVLNLVRRALGRAGDTVVLLPESA